MIQCQICKKFFKTITNTHLKKEHNITCEEYKRKYGEIISEEVKVNLIKANKGKTRTKEQKINYRNSKLGNKNPNFGKLSPKKGKTNIEFYGIEKAKEINAKISIKTKEGMKTEKAKEGCKKGGYIHKGKIYGSNVKRFGEERALIISENISKGTKNSMKDVKIREKISKKAKIRFIEKKERDGVLSWPNYTPIACEVFKQFDELNNTHGIYATYGGREYRIPKTSYFVDYINFDLKIIIECDTPDHFDRFGNQLERHIKRQKEIQEKFSDFKFLRFKVEDIKKVLEIKIKGE